MQVADGRCACDTVGIKELRLGLSTISTLAVPPPGAATVDEGSAGSTNFDAGARDGNQRSSPFFIAEGCRAFEDDLVMASKPLVFSIQIPLYNELA